MNYKNLIGIAIGGAIGTMLRYTLNVYTLFVGYPIGTVIENVVGSLLLGLLTGWFLHQKPREWVKLGLGVGFCGGFTTMSTLAADSLFLYQQMSLLESSIYLAISLVGGLTFAFVGLLLGTKWSETKEEKEGQST
ncbi:fluoride efflux transporter FluC [Alkalihalobacterium elongatum]|uniref:fluoride efflux transporter FluC n=1 Tax=Alkalihalobacterium elongatum TaxID=2675466 RepID=UPI001C1F814C|nr:CrcB family protein [Alkalihalobacterium elongatum]